MSGPKIKIDADVSSVNNAMGQTAKGMQQSEKAAKALEEQLKRTARAQAILAKEGIKLSQEQAAAAKKAFDAWRSSGARGTRNIKNTEFDDWAGGGWRNYSMSPTEASSHREQVLRSIGIGGGPNGRPSFGSFLGNAFSTAGRGVARSIFPMGGVGGRIATSGVEAAADSAGGIMSGGGMARILGGVGIGALAMGAFKMIQGVHAGYGRAESEAGDYSDLRRALGVTSNDFNDLRTSVRHFSDGLGLAYNETVKLASEYARSAALRSGAGLGQEVGSAAGFGRGFGLNPQATVQFMAAMRHYGASGGDSDNRKLAVMIAESVQRGGTQSKMGEVLSALQSFTTMAARASLTTPNVGAYASFMSAMTGSNLPGMKGDPENAAAAMNAADSALRRGGAFGQASRSFTLGMYQRQLKGFTALDMDYMGEQGAFGSIGNAFGKNSAAYAFAKSRGDQGLMDKYDSWASASGGQSVLAMQMQALEKEYGGNTDGFRNAIQSHLGVGASQAGALYSAYKADKGLGGLQSILNDAGVDTSKMNTQTIAALAEISGGGMSGVHKQAARLRGLKGSSALSENESTALSTASSDDELRKVVLKLTSIHDTSKDEGTKLREQQADMSNAMQELATKLIPLTMMIKDGVIELVKTFTLGGNDWTKKMDQNNRDEASRKLNAGRTGGDRITGLNNVLSAAPGTYSEDYIADVKAELAQAMSGGLPGKAAPAASPRTGGGKGPRNLRNNNPGNIRAGAWANRHGAIGSDGGFAVFPDAATGSRAMDALLHGYVNNDGLNTIAQIESKWAPSSENDTKNHIKNISSWMGVGPNEKLDLNNPDVLAAYGKSKARQEGSAAAYVAGGELVIQDNRNMTGQRVKLAINKRTYSPQPAGMGGISG